MSEQDNYLRYVIRSCGLVIISMLVSLSIAAQTTAPKDTETADAKQKSETVSNVKTDAKPPAKAKDPARQSPKQLKIGSVDFSGSLRLRVNNYGWFETKGFEDNYTFTEATLRLSLGQQKEKYDWLVEGEFPFLINLPEQSIAPAPQGQLGLGASYFAANGRRKGSAILKQAFVRVKGLFGDKASSLRVGRFEFIDGTETMPADATLATLKRDQIAHRLIGNFGFSTVGRSFDAVQYVRNTKSGNFTFVGGRPTEGVFQLRGMKELDVDFWYAAYTKPLKTELTANEFRIFLLHYHDGRGALKTDNRALALRLADRENIRLTSIGGNYLAALKTKRGTVDLLAWGVGQFGNWGGLSHRAGAFVFEGGFQPAGPLASVKAWFRGGYSRTSGDGDAADDEHTTFFQVLPTPRLYARFPFYNMMNNEDLYAQVRLRPVERVALRADVRYLRLSNRNDLWYSGGGAFQEATFGYTGRASGGRKTLGTLFDLSVDISLTTTTTLTFYGAGVRGGSVASSIYPAGGANPTSRLFYAELLKRF
ncbi:MAG TPA: alginate export family protein [Pyrinomonadaceae bacterium]|nr:alginate export family protein [Pyrinomonadaceae bacterium]